MKWNEINEIHVCRRDATLNQSIMKDFHSGGQQLSKFTEAKESFQP